MSNPNEVPLNKWIVEQLKLIAEFEVEWSLNQLKNPTDYPEFMGRGDWDEQFTAFCELKDAAEQGPQD